MKYLDSLSTEDRQYFDDNFNIGGWYNYSISEDVSVISINSILWNSGNNWFLGKNDLA